MRRIKIWCGVVSAVAAAVTVAWAMPDAVWSAWGAPRVEVQIQGALAPVLDALEYNNALHMSTKSEEELKRAEWIYLQSKRGRGVGE